MLVRRLAVVLLLALAMDGCSLAGRTFGRYYDDRTITGSVKRGLVGQHPRGMPRVTVDTYEGSVYLSGEVETPAQKAEAEAAARGVEGVTQVINDLRVRSDVPSASPRMTAAASPLQERLPGLARIDPALPGGPALAYDRAGTIVATVYVRALRDVGVSGFDDIGTPVRAITHVSLYPVPMSAVQPEALVTIVLWHISPAAAAALK